MYKKSLLLIFIFFTSHASMQRAIASEEFDNGDRKLFELAESFADFFKIGVTTEILDELQPHNRLSHLFLNENKDNLKQNVAKILKENNIILTAYLWDKIVTHQRFTRNTPPTLDFVYIKRQVACLLFDKGAKENLFYSLTNN